MKGNFKYLKIEQLSELEDNPRYINEDDFERLCTSLKDNPEYFEARPIIVSNRTGKNVVIAGNQRLKGARHIGLKEVPVFILPGLTEAKEREIIIRDNVSNGKWDFDALANNGWDENLLKDWGLDIPFFEGETDLDDFFEDKGAGTGGKPESDTQIVLEYPADECAEVKSALLKIDASPEQAVWLMLKEKGLVK